MLKVAIITGSTRPGRQSLTVSKWVHQIAEQRTDAVFEVLDIADYNLPLLDEPVPALMAHYTKDHTRRWSAAISSFDAYVFVTPEYNHSIPAALKNALDYLNHEWGNKAAACVSYGGANGARAVEQLRTVLCELRLASVRGQVGLSMFDDFENYSVFKPRDRHIATVSEMLDQLVGWGTAMKAYRQTLPAPVAS